MTTNFDDYHSVAKDNATMETHLDITPLNMVIMCFLATL